MGRSRHRRRVRRGAPDRPLRRTAVPSRPARGAPSSAPRSGRSARPRGRSPRSRRTCATITKPSRFRSMFSNQPQNGPGEAELRGEQAAELDRADHERDRDREAGDGDVVEDLAHRLRERPAVGEVHERAVDRVEQRHARRRRGPAGRGSRTRAARRRRRRRRARAARPRWRCRSRGRTGRRSGTSAAACVTVRVSRPR